MFRTSIVTDAGTDVDFDRAAPLMDRDLLQAAIEFLQRNRHMIPPGSTASDAQRIWDVYCHLHYEKYDEDFLPDVVKGWGQPPVTVEAPPERDYDPPPDPSGIRVLGLPKQP